MKPIALDLPYPNTDGLECDERSATIISPAYAGLYGELTATLQYRYHSLYFSSYERQDTAGILDGISIAEMRHLHILGGLIPFTRRLYREAEYTRPKKSFTEKIRKIC